MAEVTLFGRKYPLVGPSEFTLGELNDGETYFGAEFNDEAVNSRKLSAILYVSVRRVNQSVKPSDIRDLSASDLEAIHAELMKWQEEDEGDASPPAEGADAPPSSASDSNGSPATASESDPSSTGVLASGTGSDSVRLISAN